MRKAMLLLTATASPTMTAITFQAAIGWNLKKREQAFGKPIIGPRAALTGRTSYEFETKDFYINTHWTNNSKDLFASFADNWTTFVLWTQADRDAIRAALKTSLLESLKSKTCCR
jgi:hypothetical protein